MTYYGSMITNETVWSDRLPSRPARHIACPQRLKYIRNMKDGYIPYVEDSVYVSQQIQENAFKQANQSGIYTSMNDWRQELMGLAQQVQTSLSVLKEARSSKTNRSNRQRSRRPITSAPVNPLEEDSEQNPLKRTQKRHSCTRNHLPVIVSSKTPADVKEKESSTTSNTQDPGIWLLPLLCHVLHVDNILEAQEWLINANLTEKRLAMELISRNMQDMQENDNEPVLDSATRISSPRQSNSNNVYWPYKFWQHQQSKISGDSNDTCERATSPVRILTPAKRLPTSILNDRMLSANDRVPTFHRTETASTRPLPNQTPPTYSPPHFVETWRPSSRHVTPPMTASENPPSRRGYRVLTSRTVATETDNKSTSASLRGKTPLV